MTFNTLVAVHWHRNAPRTADFLFQFFSFISRQSAAMCVHRAICAYLIRWYTVLSLNGIVATEKVFEWTDPARRIAPIE